MPNEASEIVVPVYMPTESGVSEIVLGEGTLKEGILTVAFNDKFPSEAIQRMFARGHLLGMSFVLISDESVE